MYEGKFSSWRSWTERGNHLGISLPGVYAIALTNTKLAGRPFAWRKDIVYVGMTNSVVGLKGRLKKFDNTMLGKGGHGGADRVRFAYRNYRRFCKLAYVAVTPFQCDPASKIPRDLRIMGEVARLEYRCFAHFVERFGRLPRFNDWTTSKYSLTVGRSRRASGAT